MKKQTLLLTLILALATAPSLHAKLIRHFTMAEQIPRSAIVVYCEEKDVKPQDHASTIAKCVVLKTIKGDIAPGVELTIDYGSCSERIPFGAYGGKSGPLPAGKALLFLIGDGKGVFHVVDARLVQDGKVFDFEQARNPGPLEPFPARPENITLGKDETYGEKELLDDLDAAVKKAAAATAAYPVDALKQQ